MISSQHLFRYPFFAGLRQEHIKVLTDIGEQLSVEAGHCFFREGESLEHLYMVLSGDVAISLAIPDRRAEHDVRDHILNNFRMNDVTVSTVGPGQIFGWSAIIPPRESTASAQAMSACSVLSFNCRQLEPHFREDCEFGYAMLLKVASTVRQRLQDMHVQSLYFTPA